MPDEVLRYVATSLPPCHPTQATVIDLALTPSGPWKLDGSPALIAALQGSAEQVFSIFIFVYVFPLCFNIAKPGPTASTRTLDDGRTPWFQSSDDSQSLVSLWRWISDHEGVLGL